MVHRKSIFIIAILISMLIFTGCSEKLMNVSDYPVTQGSNPTRIISEKIFMHFTGLDDKKGDYFKIRHTGTPNAYKDFLAADTDIDMIIAQTPDEDTENKMKSMLFKAIAKDALVFITNKDNPVDNLAFDELKAILKGDIINWNEVGGRDEPINLFRQVPAGGSQTLVNRFILKNEPMKDVPESNIAASMELMSQYVAEGIENGAAIGFTTYYFAEFSGKRNDIKIININNIKPKFDSIKNNSYIFIANIYIAVKNMDSPAGKIYEWITTKAGQELIESTGYVPL